MPADPKLLALLAAYKAKKAAQHAPQILPQTSNEPSPTNLQKTSQPQEISVPTQAPPSSQPLEITDKYGNLITLNSKQAEFVSLASSGEDCVLIGPAGTGKTTCQKAVTTSLIQNGKAGLLSSEGHKHLVSDTPGIVICAYTRRAVANIRRNMPADLQSNCITIHKLLEYQPVYYSVSDPVTGEEKNKMKFEATRNALNPLPSSIRILIFEESSMLGTELFEEVMAACPHKPQIILLGDIQQLPPVFGPAILGFKLISLPTIELTEVYRQALESPIISLAHRILSGHPINPKPTGAIDKSSEHRKQFLTDGLADWKSPGQLTLHPWKQKLSPEVALNVAGQFFIQAENSGAYKPDEDIILIPFNKAFGTDELNKKIANHLARKFTRITHEIIAGFNKIYLSVGDKVLYDKEDATIIDIQTNPGYAGAPFTEASATLDYWGHDPILRERTNEEMSDDAVDFLLAQVAMTGDEERVHKASHTITLQMNDSEREVKIDTASELNALSLGYCLTVHKSQGSEWRKVFFVLHQSHATMVSRELLYTGVTRAREELYIICEPETFVKGIQSQRVKGNTLAEKAEYFKGKEKTLTSKAERIFV